MGLHVFKLPDIGEGIAESEIAAWHVKVGDVIKEEQALVDMLTDKAAVELPSPVAGKVVELKGAPGDKIPVGGALAVIETSGAGSTVEEKKPADDRHSRAGGNPVVASPKEEPGPRLRGGDEHRPLASPATRRRAREANVDLAQISGTGPGGRVTPEDLEKFCAGGIRVQIPISKSGNWDPTPNTAIEEIKVIGLRRKIAESMQRSKQRIPHFAYVEELDVTELEALREHL